MQTQLRRAAVTACLLLFSAMCPLGAVLGMGFRQTHTTPQYQLARSTLQGLAAGSFAYVILMEEQKQKVRKLNLARTPTQTSFGAPKRLQCLNTTKISLTVLGAMAGLWTICERY
ncbi:hypothetical protein SRHO_G00056310 [Serrasalmus rhombeus]